MLTTPSGCPSSAGSPLTVTVDGGVFEALLANMIPGRKYQVTVSSVKGLEESDPSMDTVTTGGPASRLTPSCRFTSTTVSPHTSASVSFGPAADSDGAQCHRHLGPPAVAAVRSRRGRLRRHLQRRSRCVFLLFQHRLGGKLTGPMCPTVPPVVEHVSGSTVEFEMGSLAPGMRYKVGVHAVKEALKSNPAITEFTTGRVDPRSASTAVP